MDEVEKLDDSQKKRNEFPEDVEAPAGVEFSQLNLRFDEWTIAHSGWGRLRFLTEGWRHPLYCNLAMSERWQIRNVLIVPGAIHCARSEAQGNRQRSMSMTFPFGISDGTLMERIEFGLSFTRQTLMSPPSASKTAPVTPGQYSLDHDFVDTPVEYYPGRHLGGVFFSKGEPHGHSEIHNHPCGPNECVPNAVRLSMEYLWTHFNLGDKGLSWDAFELAALKKALAWTRGDGCYNGTNGSYHWEDLKDSYLRELCKNLPFRINTRRLGSSGAADAYKALGGETCVVELDTGSHCVSVRTMIPNLDAGGNVISYDVEVMNCAPQDGKDSSCTTEHLTVQPDGTLTDGQGAPWCGGSVKNWCIQCYQEVK